MPANSSPSNPSRSRGVRSLPCCLASCIALSVALYAGSASADSYAQLAVGLPEVAQIEAGYLGRRWSAGARAGLILLDPAAGIAVTRYWSHAAPNERPRHSVIVGGHAMLNLRAPGLRGGGETIASYVAIRTGYAFSSPSGFLCRVELGLVSYLQRSGPEAGPLAAISAGWRF